MQTQAMCSRHLIYAHRLQPACLQTQPMCHVPAPYYARTSVAGTRACTTLFTHICSRHACLQTQPMCLRHTIYAHPLQARVPANSSRVVAPHYLRASVAGATRYSRNAGNMTSSLVFASLKATLIYKRRSAQGYRTSPFNAL